MKLRKFILFISITLTVLFLVTVLSRNLLLGYLVSRFSDKIKSNYRADFIIGNAVFSSIRTIHLQDISLVPPSGDTLLTIQSLEINPSYYKLIMGKLSYNWLRINTVNIHVVADSSANNYSFLTIKNKDEVRSEAAHFPEYDMKLNSLFNKVFELVTSKTVIKNYWIEYRTPDNYRKYHVPVFKSDGKKYACKVYNLSQDDTIHWSVEGRIRKSEKGIDFKMCRESSSTSMVSLTGSEKSLKWLVDTLFLEVIGSAYKNKEMTMALRGNFSNLQVNYWRISPDDVGIAFGKMDFLLKTGRNFIEIDTASLLAINSFLCTIGLGYNSEKGKTYALHIRTGKIPSSALFESLPTGMFSNLQGIKTKGDISYSLDFVINKDQPDSLIFESELKKYNFSILKFGNDYLPRINDEFLYTAFDGDRPVRTFPVGPSNPEFTPSEQIINYVKYAVMTAEDGAFFLHNGFNEEAFRQSIATNVKQRRFARGGSTISMQLVKNVFLSRDKTISRKLEEALIVWLLEKNRLVTKERMLELYLNIIEWGPNIYGIREASRFYFSKLPSQLTLAESIFLASIIPRPKYFKYSFDPTGQLKPYLNGYYKLVSERMLRKNWITEQDMIDLQPSVQLRGQALQFIIPIDTIPEDSIPDENTEFINN